MALMELDIDGVEECVERASKRQRVMLSEDIKDMDNLIEAFRAAKEKMQAEGDGAVNSTLSELQKLIEKSASTALERHRVGTKDHYADARALDSHFKELSCYLDAGLDTGLLKQSIVQHFCHTGARDIAEALAKEAGLPPLVDATEANLQEIQSIISALSARDPVPALHWCQTHCAEIIKKTISHGASSSSQSQSLQQTQNQPQQQPHQQNTNTAAMMANNSLPSLLQASFQASFYTHGAPPQDNRNTQPVWTPGTLSGEFYDHMARNRRMMAGMAAAGVLPMAGAPQAFLAERMPSPLGLQSEDCTLSPQSPPPGVAADDPVVRRRAREVVFLLHKLRFVQTLVGGGRGEALKYLQQEIASTFASTPERQDDIKYLSGALLFANKLDRSPYAALLDPSLWTQAIELFSFVAHHVLWIPERSLLDTVVEAGIQATPTLMKIKSLGSAFGPANMRDVQVDLDSEFVWQSTFICPVTHGPATRENPPMLLPCNHVISFNAMKGLAKNASRFKCPYCPQDCPTRACVRIYI